MSESPTPDKVTKAPCPACAAGPTGIDGHSELRVRTMGNAAMRFECRECKTLWTRSGQGPKGYTWEKVDPLEAPDRKKGSGTPLPGR